MPISFDTWVANQTPDLLAESMGLPPLAPPGGSLLGAALAIGAGAAAAGLDRDEAQMAIAMGVAQHVDALDQHQVDQASRAVNIGRGVWVSGAERIEDVNQRRLLQQFLERAASNIHGTYLALRPTRGARTVGLLSGDFVGSISASVPPLPGVPIDVHDVIYRPHGASYAEGAFQIGERLLAWRYVTPTVALRVTPAEVREALIEAGLDDSLAADAYEWLSVQAEQLALAARAEMAAAVPAAA